MTLVIILAIVGIVAVFLFPRPRTPDVPLGLTFSRLYAEQLGVDWREAYQAMLIDLQPAQVRLPVYWSDIEPERGVFRFEEYDWMVEEARKHNVSVMLAIGRKVPRWPECFAPDWIHARIDAAQRQDGLEMIRAVVTHFQREEHLAAWQVENEPFLLFGQCPPIDLVSYQEEVELVRSLDDRPIALSVSGELEPWFHAFPFADQVGFSLYRLTWSRIFGFWAYPLQPSFYRARVVALRPFVESVYVSELQGEPWFHRPIESLTPDEQVRMFSPRMLEANVEFARRIGADRIDLWGVEWWWWMNKHGHPELWDAARKIFGTM